MQPHARLFRFGEIPHSVGIVDAAEALTKQASGKLCVSCRSGSSYIQGDLGMVKVASTGDGGVYLGASSQYPGSISSVGVDMSGIGNTVVATSNGEPDLAVVWIPMERQSVLQLEYVYIAARLMTCILSGGAPSCWR